MHKKLCIDLCAGQGGFSQAFAQSDEWEVVTVEINRKQKPTICADVRYLPIKDNLQPDLLLASPPCQRWSIANPKWTKYLGSQNCPDYLTIAITDGKATISGETNYSGQTFKMKNIKATGAALQ